MKDTNSGDSISSRREAYQKSVEEIVEELEHLVQWETPEHEKEVKDWLTQTLKAERQKCEEMVEAERERIIKKLEVYEDQEIFVPDIIEALTQPNNPN